MAISVADRAAKLASHIEYTGVDMLVFVRHDGAVESVAAASPRAVSLMAGGSRQSVVGVYSPGVSAAVLAADIRESMK